MLVNCLKRKEALSCYKDALRNRVTVVSSKLQALRQAMKTAFQGNNLDKMI